LANRYRNKKKRGSKPVLQYKKIEQIIRKSPSAVKKSSSGKRKRKRGPTSTRSKKKTLSDSVPGNRPGSGSGKKKPGGTSGKKKAQPRGPRNRLQGEKIGRSPLPERGHSSETRKRVREQRHSWRGKIGRQTNTISRTKKNRKSQALLFS